MDVTDNEEKFLSAAWDGDLERIKELITNGFISLKRHDEIADEYGHTALIRASRNGRLSIVRFLIEENSVDVNGKNNDGETALHFAIFEGYVEIMKLLIAKGANVNQQEEDGGTPLHYASYCGELYAVNLLLEMGADTLIKDNDNWNALDFARQQGHTDVVKAIQRHIQQLQQIEELIRCNDRLPIAIWPNAISRLKSVNFIHQLLCELPQLFQQTPEEAQETQQKEDEKPPSSGSHHPSQKKRKRNADHKKAIHLQL